MEDTALAQVRIVLVRPIGPLNVGAVARVMKNMGLSQLVLVDPQCEHLGEQARTMALHAADILESAQLFTSLPEALQSCARAIATTARDRRLSLHLEAPRTALPWLLEGRPSALIFGPEDRGLSNDDLKYAQRFIRIASSDAYPSLNLAQAVGICCYELYQSIGEGERDITPQPFAEENSASLEMLEQYYQQLESVLLKIGYLYPHTATSRMAKFRLLFNRAQPSTTEVAMLRGILSQIEWALSTRSASVSNAPLPSEKS
ncbi:RNA methyltransferase [Planktothrix sp. FACHB-1355]|uniref:tRNA (cytidine/uridine-2'-O-)-methyltransferase TrmJ n=1 Tax=Aerosakkonema funiforme FACHB-1375 TaxID=2949571 RepID=A0A926V9N3_9CYAN|nr:MULTISPECIES: RNA methyltransferase [Oscillatoriales]MBD2179665.1 RNA methyltransferase [Aerosakkonema funiforme FACHB-1375]MBD3562666.1 RNA methyltransferase [Planktothrix sp. FACHB-1355]